MSGPETAAGRREYGSERPPLQVARDDLRDWVEVGDPENEQQTDALIDAFEAEARAAAVAPLEKALRDLMAVNHGPEPFSDRQGNLHPCLCAAHEAARLLLASAPSPVREPELDEERLDRSMAAAGVHVDKARPGPTREIGCQSCREGIAAIAAEYARLTPERPADEVDG